MERPTTKITTPGGVEVVLKTYMTAREANTVRQAIYGSLNLSIESGKVADKIPGSVLYDQERRTLELMVVSVNGSTDKVLDSLDDLTQDEYQYVLSEVNKASRLNFTPTK